MKIKIRTHPIDIFLLTGDEAKDARAAAYCEVHGLTAFVTGSFGTMDSYGTQRKNLNPTGRCP